MIKKIKRLFCIHHFDLVSTKVITKDGHYIAVCDKYKCKKCGKVVYT